MEIKVTNQYLKIAPRKVRLVAGLIRGLDAEPALEQLKFSLKDAALPVSKLLKSALANAVENHKLKTDNLFIKEIKVDGGPITYRWLPRAYGRATPLRKRSSHLTLVLGERVPTEAKAEKTEGKKDDMVKVNDLDELKGLDSDGEKLQDHGKKEDRIKASKGFAKKIFNRKSGSK